MPSPSSGDYRRTLPMRPRLPFATCASKRAVLQVLSGDPGRPLAPGQPGVRLPGSLSHLPGFSTGREGGYSRQALMAFDQLGPPERVHSSRCARSRSSRRILPACGLSSLGDVVGISRSFCLFARHSYCAFWTHGDPSRRLHRASPHDRAVSPSKSSV